MKNVYEFNRSYFNAIVALKSEASNALKIEDKLCKNIEINPENYFSYLAESKSIIVVPRFSFHNLRNTIHTKNNFSEVVELNQQYLLLIRHLSAVDIRRASMITGVEQDLCESIKDSTIAEINSISSNNRALFACVLTNKTLMDFTNPKIITLGAKKGFLQHLQQLSTMASPIY